jgi:hypothetical protein
MEFTNYRDAALALRQRISDYGIQRIREIKILMQRNPEDILYLEGLEEAAERDMAYDIAQVDVALQFMKENKLCRYPYRIKLLGHPVYGLVWNGLNLKWTVF